MAALETIVLILAAITTIKISILLIKPKVWMNFDKWIIGGNWFTGVIFLLLAALIFYYLIQELTIVQILAVTFFASMLIGVSYAIVGKEMIKVYEKHMKTKGLWSNGMWFYTLLWLVLIAWGVIEILA